MRLFRCRCSQRHHRKIHRSWWMKVLFPGRGLYRCDACGTTMLVPEPRELRRLP